jgi:hypothetical protein
MQTMGGDAEDDDELGYFDVDEDEAGHEAPGEEPGIDDDVIDDDDDL